MDSKETNSEVETRATPIPTDITSLTFFHEISKRSIYKVGRYLREHPPSLDPYLVPTTVLRKAWSKGLGIVSQNDKATHCFTAGYGRIYHRSTGSLLLIPGSKMDLERKGEALEVFPLDRSDMALYENQLRRFQPEELLGLFGFVEIDEKSTSGDSDDGNGGTLKGRKKIFEIPPSVVPSLEQRYKLIGNSISVDVVTELMRELLFSV